MAFSGLASLTPRSRRQSRSAFTHARYIRLFRSVIVPASRASRVHQLDVQRETRRALDQRLLHVVGIAADMSGQFGPRGNENLTLTGAPVEALKQPVLPRMRTERRLYAASWAVPLAQQTWRNVAHQPATRQALYLRVTLLCFERQGYCARRLPGRRRFRQNRAQWGGSWTRLSYRRSRPSPGR